MGDIKDRGRRPSADVTQIIGDTDRVDMVVRPADTDRTPCFIVLSGQLVGQILRLEEDTTVIGRSGEAGICLRDAGVSRQHAEVAWRGDGEVWLRDLGSTNGTYVEGNRIDDHKLCDGDRVQIGSVTILKFSFSGGLEESFASKLYESATRDPLTDLFNRRTFEEHLDREIAWHARHDSPLSLLLFDVDHFKQINDTHGHLAGDAVLAKVAQISWRTCRTEDIVARYGGDEFVCILRQTDHASAMIVAERLRASIEGAEIAHQLDGVETQLSATISVGVATTQGSALTNAADLFEGADSLLYQSKEKGRNRVTAAEIRA